MPSPDEVGLNVRFDQKIGGALVKLRRRRAFLTFSAAAAPELFHRRRRGATGVELYFRLAWRTL